MKFNEQAILNLVKSHTTGNALTWETFDRLFSFLSGEEKDAVADILAARGISLENADDDMARAFAAEFAVDGSAFGGNDPLAFSAGGMKGGSRMNELLARAARMGSEDAKEQLFRDNDALVWDVARKYTYMCGTCLSEEDLHQAGALGMMKAVERFNYDLGYKFSTYALWWIRQAIIREAENNCRTIRVPVHKQEQVRRVMRVYNNMFHQKAPTVQRISAVVKALEQAGYPQSENQVIECIQLNDYVIGCVSLDMPVGEDGDTVLGDFVAADRKDNPETLLEKMCLHSDLMDVLATLMPREAQIIIERYGLDGMGERTLEDIGKEFKVTRERIRQIEAKAMRKLRHPSRSRKLREYLEAA